MSSAPRPALAKVILRALRDAGVDRDAASVATAAAVLRALDSAGVDLHIYDAARWERAQR